MPVSDEIESRILAAVARFEGEQMGLQPASVQVVLQSDTLYVILQGITSPAERAHAEDEQSEALLEEYDGERHNLAAEMQTILGRAIERSLLKVDSVSGNAIFQFYLCNPAERPDSVAKKTS